MEAYRHIVFAHTGDTMPIDSSLVSGADILVHDATFLEGGDRKWEIHASTEEALAAGRDAKVKRLLLHHLSIRYERPESLTILRAQVKSSGFAGECWLLDDSRFVPLG